MSCVTEGGGRDGSKEGELQFYSFSGGNEKLLKGFKQRCDMLFALEKDQSAYGK